MEKYFIILNIQVFLNRIYFFKLGIYAFSNRCRSRMASFSSGQYN